MENGYNFKVAGLVSLEEVANDVGKKQLHSSRSCKASVFGRSGG